MNKTTLAIGQWLFYVFDVYGIENRVQGLGPHSHVDLHQN